MEKINICLSSDDNYSKYLGVVIASILSNTNSNDIAFYILDGGISEENKNKIKSLISLRECSIIFVSVDESLFDVYKSIKTHSYISLSACYILKLASLLPNCKKILYLDCDTIVNTEILELYNINIKNYYIAGVRDIATKHRGYIPPIKAGNFYINSGVVLFNLDKIRECNIEEKFEKYTKENIESIRVGDQEIINMVCQGMIKELDSEWNVQSSNFVNRSDYTNTLKIVHYIGKQKPWYFASMNYWKDLYFDNLQKTPWKLSKKDEIKFRLYGQIFSILRYIKHRPLFFLRPRFYKAIYMTYLKKKIVYLANN